ncbi:sulfonate transport system ATP-binding protein [Paenarthrobacter nitroguajacolicus]|uniref:ABC transporter ATP-binding protein n=1 Tax=Paenarthrobacter nitroguajacolicus TaxID=211146 RepID=UPI00285C3539|nr:ABC transporter ATP-binding protein [Paenarthrobacter nitroguajacolicus]MDR6985742.1 sulfonate transport system ATP-binding protein [Paenarthrobacter nitroguajacolicus]
MATHSGGLTPAPTYEVSVRNLIRSFGPKGVLNGVNLDIAPGEFVALLGPSGCGKSTLLRALAGLDRDVRGSGVVKVPNQVSVVFQDSRLLPWDTVLGNVTLGLTDHDADARGRRALAEVGLAGREKAWPHELSGGEQQRVALARSLVREPRLLLADEPFGALDALTRLKMHALLKDLVAAHRPAVLLVTHDVDEAITLADRVIVLQDGRVALERRAGTAVDHSSLRGELLEALGVHAAA